MVFVISFFFWLFFQWMWYVVKEMCNRNQLQFKLLTHKNKIRKKRKTQNETLQDIEWIYITIYVWKKNILVETSLPLPTRIKKTRTLHLHTHTHARVHTYTGLYWLTLPPRERDQNLTGFSSNENLYPSPSII